MHRTAAARRVRSTGSLLALITFAATGSVVSRSEIAQAATVPAGFSDTAVASFAGPVAVEWLPDGRLVVLEQSGRVRVGVPGGSFATALTIDDICFGGERGLLGFTHGPAYLTNGEVFVYYTRDATGFPGGCVNRVSRFVLAGNTIERASEVVLLDNISAVNTNHNGGDLDVGSDGFLYVATGDAGRDPRGDSSANDAAQDVSLLNGKILRITRDGRPAPGNPWAADPNAADCAFRGNLPDTPTNPCREIFAWGLRNPYRFAFDRNDGSDRFFINDVGQNTREEVDNGVLGGNYGWPEREGFCARGVNPPCSPQTAGYVDPILDYGRSDGTFITAGAFVPNGMWPSQYDGAYFFADGGSGRMWVRFANGSVDLAAPFATGAFGIADMTFGFDASGRLTLYYVQVGGGLRAITWTNPPGTNVRTNMRLIPISPFRAYDTGLRIGVAAGDLYNGATRVVDLDPPGTYEAALVNVTLDATQGAGFLRTWSAGARRPTTSTVNADRPASTVANAVIVPLDAAGRFIIEGAVTGRVVVDVMAWLDETSGSSRAGRFVAIDPVRVIDTRVPAGTAIESGSANAWSRTSDRIDFDPLQHPVPPSLAPTAGAVVISVGAIAGSSSGGYVGAFPRGGTWSETSNVNVVAGDIRANLIVVPLGTGGVSLKTYNIGDVVVDVLGVVTNDTASVSGAGLYSSIDPVRIVDTRVGLGFGPMGPLATVGVGTPRPGASAVVQNVTVTGTSAAGWVATHPAPAPVPVVSTVNYTANGQTRAALAFTKLLPDGREHFTSLVATDLVVDVFGTFS